MLHLKSSHLRLDEGISYCILLLSSPDDSPSSRQIRTMVHTSFSGSIVCPSNPDSSTAPVLCPANSRMGREFLVIVAEFLVIDAAAREHANVMRRRLEAIKAHWGALLQIPQWACLSYTHSKRYSGQAAARGAGSRDGPARNGLEARVMIPLAISTHVSLMCA
jgi:hypothetical protein